MKNKEQFKRILSFISSLILMVIFALIFANVWYEYYSNTIALPYYRKGNWLVIGIYVLIMGLFMKIYGSYKVWYLKTEDAIYSQILSIVCANIIEYLQISLIGRNFMSVPPIMMLTILELVFSITWTFAVSFIFRKLYPPRKMVIIYDSTKLAETLVEKMSLRSDKYIICKAVSISKNNDFNYIVNEIKDFSTVVICDIDNMLRSSLIKYCFQTSKRVYITPTISDIIVRGAGDVTLFDTPLILCRNNGLSFEQRFCKRFVDILVSLIAIIPLSPIMLICAIAVKLEDGGNVLYKQVRLTQSGREFKIYKFRSMIKDAEKDGVPRLATDNDSRITKVGAVLRKYRLDELPQLFNILKGDMSLIGPRPERPELTTEYEKTMPEFRFRLRVKAGLTGYAQVTGRYDTTPYDKLKMDLMYIENYSLLLDLRICFMTLKIILFPVKTNAEELEEVTHQMIKNDDQDKKK